MNDVGIVILWTLVGYLSGSVMYSRLIADRFLRTDLSTVGDGNPGTWNVAKAGGKGWGMMAFFLDVMKGTIPVSLAYYLFGIGGAAIVIIAMGPPIGHRYPLFYRFQGGKGVAVVFGIWIALTIWEAPTVGGLMLLYWYLSVESSSWATLFATMSLTVYLIFARPEPVLLGFAAFNILYFLWTMRADLRAEAPGIQPWVRNVALLWHRS